MVKAPYSIVRGGFKMYLLEDDNYICRDLRKKGEWEPGIADLIEKHSGPDKTFLDLGAHCGFFSLVASRCYKHVIAVEPNPMAWSVFERNIEINGIENIELHKVALWNHDKGVEMVTPIPNTGMAWVTREEKPNAVSLPSRRLSQILRRRTPEVWKVDIEGAEVKALRGYKYPPTIITEYCTSQLERTSKSTGLAYWKMLKGYDWYTLGEERLAGFDELPTSGYDNFILHRRSV